MIPDKDEPVRPYSEAPVAKMADEKGLFQGKGFFPVVDHDEIVASTMIFRKSGRQPHFSLIIVKNSKYL
jgi:hypothetical protein